MNKGNLKLLTRTVMLLVVVVALIATFFAIMRYYTAREATIVQPTQEQFQIDYQDNGEIKLEGSLLFEQNQYFLQFEDDKKVPVSGSQLNLHAYRNENVVIRARLINNELEVVKIVEK